MNQARVPMPALALDLDTRHGASGITLNTVTLYTTLRLLNCRRHHAGALASLLPPAGAEAARSLGHGLDETSTAARRGLRGGWRSRSSCGSRCPSWRGSARRCGRRSGRPRHQSTSRSPRGRHRAWRWRPSVSACRRRGTATAACPSGRGGGVPVFLLGTCTAIGDDALSPAGQPWCARQPWRPSPSRGRGHRRRGCPPSGVGSPSRRVCSRAGNHSKSDSGSESFSGR